MLIVKKRNIEKVISNCDLSKFKKKGYVELEKRSNEPEQQKSLEEMTVPDLKEIAKSLGIDGYSSLNKPELIKVIRVHNESD